jgi:hypothetical protein
MAGSSDERVSCEQPVGNIDMARRWQRVVVMKKTETKQILELLTQLTEAVMGPAALRPPTKPKPSLSDRVDKLDTRVSEVQLGLATLAADTKAQFQKVDERFDRVDRSIVSARVQLVDLVTRVHCELTGRIVDVEKPGPGGRGRGGSGSGGSGVPLAS